jgi:signal peptidase II
VSPGGPFLPRLPFAALAAAIGIADQATKALAVRALAEQPPLEVVPGLFRLVLVRNSGALFGIFQGLEAPWRVALFVLLPVAVVAALCGLALRTSPSERRALASYALLLGGALGNLIDRLRLGQVIDFLDFYIVDARGVAHHWPAFNLADACICLGIALLALESWRPRPAGASGGEHASDPA